MFKATASDGLTLYAVLCKFFTDVLLPAHVGNANHARLVAMIASYTCLCDIIDLLQMSKHGRQIEATLLDAKIAAWVSSHKAAYGQTLTYLKTHLTQHLSDVLRARQANKSNIAILVACWALNLFLMHVYV